MLTDISVLQAFGGIHPSKILSAQVQNVDRPTPRGGKIPCSSTFSDARNPFPFSIFIEGCCLVSLISSFVILSLDLLLRRITPSVCGVVTKNEGCQHDESEDGEKPRGLSD